jgi:hypothetical protein
VCFLKSGSALSLSLSLSHTTPDWESPSNACISYMPALQLWRRSCREVLACPWLLAVSSALLNGCCVTKIRAKLQLALDHHARRAHTGGTGKAPCLNLCTLDTYSPGYRVAGAKFQVRPKTSMGAVTKRNIPALAGSRNKLNGPVIILPRYPSPQRAGRSRSRIPVGGEIFRTRPRTHPASCTIGTGSLSRVYSGRDVVLNTASSDVK